MKRILLTTGIASLIMAQTMLLSEPNRVEQAWSSFTETAERAGNTLSNAASELRQTISSAAADAQEAFNRRFGKKPKQEAQATPKPAVIIVDIQGDFTEAGKKAGNGSLPVLNSGKEYIAEAEEATKKLKDKGFFIVATADQHPPKHVSFASKYPGKKLFEVIKVKGAKGAPIDQVLWPDHCVVIPKPDGSKEVTPGAEILISSNLIDFVVPKGTDIDFDSYSGFADNNGKETILLAELQRRGITEVVIYGIATDYCVRATALHAVERGFRVSLIKDLCRGVTKETTENALAEMESPSVGVHVYPTLSAYLADYDKRQKAGIRVYRNLPVQNVTKPMPQESGVAIAVQ